MNHREPPHLSAATRRALHCLSLLLLPAMAPEGVHALPRSTPPGAGADRRTDPKPYLPAMGAPPLRFQEATPPPDLVTRPAAAAPPTPALTLTETSVAQANAAATRSATVNETPVASAAQPQAGHEESTVKRPAPAKTPASILPDNVRPAVRPEDFLPYFQIPGSAQTPADVTLLVPAPKAPPAPAPLPPSSASYRQTP
jgi:hypothetical protein